VPEKNSKKSTVFIFVGGGGKIEKPGVGGEASLSQKERGKTFCRTLPSNVGRELKKKRKRKVRRGEIAKEEVPAWEDLKKR